VPGKNWKALTEELRDKVNLPAYPVGIKLLKKPRELLDYREVRLLTDTTVCHMAAIARHNRGDGIVGASSLGSRCLQGCLPRTSADACAAVRRGPQPSIHSGR
jgi:uncharacterized protein (DUF169 family)